MHNKCIWHKIKNKSKRPFHEKQASLFTPTSALRSPWPRSCRAPGSSCVCQRTRTDKHDHLNGSMLGTVLQLTFSMAQPSPVGLPGRRPLKRGHILEEQAGVHLRAGKSKRVQKRTAGSGGLAAAGQSAAQLETSPRGTGRTVALSAMTARLVRCLGDAFA